LTIDDSVTDIFKILGDCAKISQSAGGIGLCISNIRANGSKIRGTNGISDGIVPMAKVFNDTANYWTSSEVSSNNAMRCYWGDGSIASTSKSATAIGRWIRYF